MSGTPKRPPEMRVGGVTVVMNAEHVRPSDILTWLEWHGDMFAARRDGADHAMRIYRSAWDLTFVWAGYGPERTRIEQKIKDLAPKVTDRLAVIPCTCTKLARPEPGEEEEPK